jgi:hypothetical protein
MSDKVGVSSFAQYASSVETKQLADGIGNTLVSGGALVTWSESYVDRRWTFSIRNYPEDALSAIMHTPSQVSL